MSNKIKSAEEIKNILEKLREERKKIVTTNGSFDILHSAHIRILEEAKKEGDVLIVLLNSDGSIKKLKGDKRPILNENERSSILSALESVDYIVIFNEDKPLDILKIIKPDIHVKGGSFIQQRIAEEEELLKSWNGKLKTLPLIEGHSTTNIIDRILENFKDQ